MLRRNSAADLDRWQVRILAFDRTSHFATLIAAEGLRAVDNLRKENLFSVYFKIPFGHFHFQNLHAACVSAALAN